MATQQTGNVTWQIKLMEKVGNQKMAKENNLIPRKKGSMNGTIYFGKEDKRKNFSEGEY